MDYPFIEGVSHHKTCDESLSCFTIMFSVGFTITMVFPYLPFMVKFLLPDVEEKDIGRYAGFLASSFYFGRFCGSYFWGWLADKYSKKTILMCSGICMAFSSLFFGFSVNFYMAIFFRYMTGLTNGVVGNVRAILCEHSDNKNQGLGMSITTIAWGASVVFGPGISGAMADPVSQYDITSNTFLEKFPYCLPSMFSALLSVTGVTVVAYLLPVEPEDKQGDVDTSSGEALTMEGIPVASHDQECSSNTSEFEETACTELPDSSDINLTVKKVSASENSVELQDSESSLNEQEVVTGVELRHNSALSKSDELSHRKPIIENEEDVTAMEELSVDEDIILQQRKKPISRLNFKITQLKKQLYSTYRVIVSLLKDKVCLCAVLLFALFAFVYVGFDEYFSLWAATSKPLGGLGFTLHQIGTALSVVGIIMVPLMLLAFTSIERRFGAQMTHHIGTATLIISVILFPSLTYLSGSPAVLWTFLIATLLIIRVALSSCVVCQALFINNSVTSDKLGAVNGLAMSVNSLLRAISPVIFGTVYSLSLSESAQDIGFPVDFHLVFLLSACGFLLTMIMTSFLPKSTSRCRPVMLMLRTRCKRYLQQHHITKHMMKVYFACYVILVPGGLVVTMIFPYLPFMVKFLLPDLEERNIGRYSGFLASSMYFGGLCSSYFWGWLADKHNKKTVLMYSGICMAFSSLFFGFSVNFYMAIIFRFLTGLANGIVINVKSIISEHSDDVNQGFGMSLVIALWDASIVFGPAISGVLADPVGQYDLPTNSFLAKFPYCLPNMFTALLCVLGVAAVGCLLPDEPEAKSNSNSEGSKGDNELTDQMCDSTKKSHDLETESHDLETGSHDHVVGSCDSDTVHSNLNSDDNIIEELSVKGLSYKVLLKKEEMEMDAIPMDDIVVYRDTEQRIKTNKKLSQVKKQVVNGCKILVSLLRDKVTCGAVLLHGLYAFGVIGFEECFSLWSATSRPLGGLGFSPHNIGIVLGIAGILLVPLSLAVFIPLEKKFGALMAFHAHIAVVIISLPFFPSLTYISPNQTAVLWILLNVLSVVIRVAINNCFVCESLFLNNSVTADKLGAANGLAGCVTNIFQIFSPVLFSIIYSLSLSDRAKRIGFPVDFHLTFILISFVFFLTMMLVAFFPKQLDKQKK